MVIIRKIGIVINKLAGDVLAEVTRGGVVESLHLGHLIILNSDGSTYLSKGSPELSFYPRSAVKSLQASAMLKAGLTVSDEELAIVCASHSGNQIHIDLVTKMLADRGIPLSAMGNASDRPLGEKEKITWGDKAGTQLTQNCSGKHAGMLITCQQNGWDLGTYLEMSHPLQIAITRPSDNAQTWIPSAPSFINKPGTARIIRVVKRPSPATNSGYLVQAVTICL